MSITSLVLVTRNIIKPKHINIILLKCISARGTCRIDAYTRLYTNKSPVLHCLLNYFMKCVFQLLSITATNQSLKIIILTSYHKTKV